MKEADTEAKLGQAQVKLDDIVEVEAQLLFQVGGWWVGGRIKRS